MKLGEALMKVIIKVTDVVALAKRFEAAPAEAMTELMGGVRQEVKRTLERVMEAEIGLFLGKHSLRVNKRNGFTVRRFGIKGLGTIEVRVPRDRLGYVVGAFRTFARRSILPNSGSSRRPPQAHPVSVRKSGGPDIEPGPVRRRHIDPESFPSFPL